MRRLMVIAFLFIAAPAQAFPHANRCVTASGTRVFVKPVSLHRALLFDGKRNLGDTEWRVRRRVAVAPATGVRLRLRPARTCAPFPEAGLGVRGRPFRGSLRGFADAHLHVTASLRAGGRVISGEPFARHGIQDALGRDADVHGADGSADLTGNLLRGDSPVATHDVAGWPSFTGWPTPGTNTHQQIYWRWLQRAWRGGLRLVVAQTVEDEPLCEIEPKKAHGCDETETLLTEVGRLRALQDYVDAQAGGRGRGFFRIVRGPREAARVIRAGRLAVVIGAESSNVFGCSQALGVPACDRAKIDAGITRLKDAGIRGLFLAHWVDNALGGAALEPGAKGTFISLMQVQQTGAPFVTSACPDPAQGSDCNVRGLTDLGEYAVGKLMDAHMLIEVDHLSERARDRVLELAAARDYPLVSSHTGTGGTWTPTELRSLAAHGGFAAVTVDEAPQIGERTRELVGYPGLGVGLGSDTGGFKTLPGATPGVAYPFRLSGATFTRQRTGERSFDVTRDGMAHYGLLPDVLAAVDPAARDTQAGGAAAYVRTWRRTGAAQ